MYYMESLTQAAIADRVDSTRWTVGRLLEEARERGIVTISINHPHARRFDLEKRLVEELGAREAIVVPTQSSDSATGSVLAEAAAEYLTGLRPRPTSMGVAWGRTVTRIARAMPAKWTKGLEVFQTYGGLVRSNDDEVADSIGLMALKGRGIGHLLPAPAIVADPELGRRLKKEPSVARTLEAAPAADVVLFSPGVLSTESVLVRNGYLSPEEMEEIKGLGAVMDLFTHFIDAEGRPVSAELEDRCIGIELEALARAKRSVVVGAGSGKADPIRYCLAGGFANVVVTDSATAQGVLEGAAR